MSMHSFIFRLIIKMNKKLQVKIKRILDDYEFRSSADQMFHCTLFGNHCERCPSYFPKKLDSVCYIGTKKVKHEDKQERF